MSFFQWEDIDLNAGNIVVDKIVSVNAQNMTASLEKFGNSVPIHYHCKQSTEDDGRSFDETYPNELDEGGAAAFATGDEVLVLFRRVNNTSPVIIGFRGEPKGCVTLVDIAITINGVVPTSPVRIFITDSNVDEEGHPDPHEVTGASLEKEPGIVRDIDISNLVFPIKVYLASHVNYYTPDPEGSVYFYAVTSDPIMQGPHETYIKSCYGPILYDEQNPPDTSGFDYYSGRLNPVSRTLANTYTEDEIGKINFNENGNREIRCDAIVYTMKCIETYLVINDCDCSTETIGPYSFYVSKATFSKPYTTSIMNGSDWCPDDEYTGVSGSDKVGLTAGEMLIQTPYLQSDEDGQGVSGGASIDIDCWHLSVHAVWYEYDENYEIKRLEPVCEVEPTTVPSADKYVWTVVPLPTSEI